MLPLTKIPASEPPSKPRSPELLLNRKNSFNSLQPYLSFFHLRTWLILFILFLQIFLILSARSRRFLFSTTISPPQKQFPPSFPTTIIAADSVGTVSAQLPAAYESTVNNSDSTVHECPYGKVYIYDLPPSFNAEILENCRDLNPWSYACDTLSNDGFGKTANGISGLIPENLRHAWFWTDQFALEVIHHNRMMKYRCRSLEPESATAYYIPFYAGLAVGRYLWSDTYTAKDRDRDCEMMLQWVRDQPYWNKSDGWDHFISMGRISWDFRRSKDHDWGSSCIYLPFLRNITRLLIERNPWDYFDVGVPYPTGFHPSSAADVTGWQNFLRTRQRNTLYSFAGATRGFIKNDFRGMLLSQCENDRGLCRVVDCVRAKCANGTSAILETFLDSKFCLQPRGDSFTRRSIFDCMIAGSIPVFFWRRTAYLQYEWFLPVEQQSYSVFINRYDVKNGTSIKKVLENISEEKVKTMQEKVIENLPRIIYAMPREGLEGIKDAFDIAVEGVLRRAKEQGGGYKW